MKTSRHQNVARRKRRIERRLRPRTWTAQATPMYRTSNIHYEHSDRIRGLASGGIGAMHRLAQQTGLVDAIDRHVEVLKVALPYHESDHVLNLAYNALCQSECPQVGQRASSGRTEGWTNTRHPHRGQRPGQPSGVPKDPCIKHAPYHQ